MADDVKLSQQLVMTPQLQMAIKLLQTRSSELPVEQWFEDYPGLANRGDEPEEIGDEEIEIAAEQGRPVWSALAESPLPVLAEIPDVWIFGNPPQARANANAYPRLEGTDRESRWVVRALRQRAKTYEKITQAIVDVRPQLAISLEPDTVEHVSIRDLAETVGMHESTITRVASGVRIQNLHGLITLVPEGKKLAFAKG